MTNITSLEFWADPGFTEGCVEVPSKAYVLPDPDFVPTRPDGGIWFPSKNALFSSIKLEERFPELLNMSYMRFVMTFNTPIAELRERVFYGWIDDVEVLSDDTAHPVTRVNWHVDYWQTYLAQAEFKYGVVKRRPNTGDIPIQNPPYRYKFTTSPISLGPDLEFAKYNQDQRIRDGTVLWLIVNYISNNNPVVYAIPVLADERATLTLQMSEGGTTYQSLSWSEFITGHLDEMYGLAPVHIMSAYVSLLPPFAYTVHDGDILRPDLPDAIPWTIEKLTNRSLFRWSVLTERPFERTVIRTFTEPRVYTNDRQEGVITDYYGMPVGKIPWGLGTTSILARIVNTTTGGYVQYWFDGFFGGVEGMTFNVPLPALDVTDNSWSAYVYSGQKEFDANSRRLATEHAFAEGVISTISGTVSNVSTGATIGALGGPMGSMGGALSYGVGNALGGMLSAGLGYQENLRNDRLVLENIASYKANQLETLLIYGDSFDWMWNYQFGPRLYLLELDEYSDTLFTKSLELNGAKVDEPTESCQSLIDIGGPLQIEGLIVGGDIPVQAKRYFRERFRSGVRMITNV